MVVRSRLTISDDRDSLEGSGFEDVFSGSGEIGASDIILDDEDLELHPLEIDFTCEIGNQREINQPPPQPVSDGSCYIFLD